MAGWKFRRQHPVGPFIVDFVCIEKKIVIEVDGGQHAENIEEDSKRSEYFKDQGYQVLRRLLTPTLPPKKRGRELGVKNARGEVLILSIKGEE